MQLGLFRNAAKKNWFRDTSNSIHLVQYLFYPSASEEKSESMKKSFEEFFFPTAVFVHLWGVERRDQLDLTKRSECRRQPGSPTNRVTVILVNRWNDGGAVKTTVHSFVLPFAVCLGVY